MIYSMHIVFVIMDKFDIDTLSVSLNNNDIDTIYVSLNKFGIAII